MKVHSYLPLAVAVALTLPASLWSQQAAPEPVRSVTREPPYELHLTTPGRCAPASHAEMVLRGESGDAKVVWQKPLINNPAWWRVDPQKGWLVTFGNECSYALEHAIVVYDDAGHVLRDYRMSDLFTPDERRVMGYWESSVTPRRLGEDDRIGNDIFSGSRVAFAEDGVWLTYNRVSRQVLLANR